MAEEESAQEKTEEATPRRKQKAREDGQVPRSKELTTTAVLLAGTVGLWLFGGVMAQNLMTVLRHNFAIERAHIFDPQQMLAHLAYSFGQALWSLAPLFGMLLLAAALGPVALGGWLFSGKALAPKLNRIDPVSGFKRMFSLKSLIELAKSIGKVAVVVAVAFLTLAFFQNELVNLSRENLLASIDHSLDISLWAAILISCSTIAIVLIDVPFQIWDFNKKLKMSKQDVKDEMKDSEGKPEVKGRIRQLQREMANKRMMANVPEADVVITNPTHYSVALKYDPDSMNTPVVLAKGVDQVALKIREIASAHKVETLRSPVLARAVYHTTDVDEPIPQGLYVAVAQVLAYIFQLRNWRRGYGQRPDFPTHLDIPREMRYD